MKQIRKNKDNFKNTTDYTSILAKNMGCDMKTQFDEPKEQIIEIRFVSFLFIGFWVLSKFKKRINRPEC